VSERETGSARIGPESEPEPPHASRIDRRTRVRLLIGRRGSLWATVAAVMLVLAGVLGAVFGAQTVASSDAQRQRLASHLDATARVINDYRIISDPPDRQFHRLAEPRAPKRPVLRSCAAIPGAEQNLCTSLREAELAMLINSARADAITEALLVTMNRDSTAIHAHDYSAAQRQYVHFLSLHSELRSVLRSRGSSGVRVAAVLRSVNQSGVLSSAQSAAAISAIEATLRRARVPAAKLSSLAKTALEARETNALDSLAGPDG
jgi:hypothetical protein